MSDFFDPPPPPEPVIVNEWDGPPRSTVPETVPIELLVAHSETAAVYLAAIAAYPTGFEFDLCVTTTTDAELDPMGFEPQAASRRSGELVPALLRFGFAFADGSKATNTGKFLDWGDESTTRPSAPVLAGLSGHGDSESWQHQFWVWPLPPPGRLEFVCEWPAAGIPLTRTDLVGKAILDAAGRVSQRARR